MPLKVTVSSFLQFEKAKLPIFLKEAGNTPNFITFLRHHIAQIENQ